MSFFKKVNENDDTPKKTSSEDKSLSYSDVNTEISDLDSLLDKVLAEKKADRPKPVESGEIRSVKASDLLKGVSPSPAPASEPEPVVIHEDKSSPADDYKAEPVEDKKEDSYQKEDLYSPLTDDKEEDDYSVASALSDDADKGSAADFLSDEKEDTTSAASILSGGSSYETPVSADDILSGNDSTDQADEDSSFNDSYYSEPEVSSYQSSHADTDLDFSTSDDIPTTDNNTEDALLVQIDAFRDKAIRLSGLINANQKKVETLEAEVKKKEGQITDKEQKIASLQDELSKKQKEADALVTTVESQVDRMLVSVKREMSSLNNNITDKISKENREESARITGILDKVNSSVLEIKSYLAEAQSDTSLDEVKEELSEKIHSENVKVYRNIQDTMKEMDHSEQLDASMDQKYRSLKHRSAIMLVVLILNFGVSAVMLLMRIGILPDNVLSLIGL